MSTHLKTAAIFIAKSGELTETTRPEDGGGCAVISK